MFKGTNLITKYKSYTKCLKAIKGNAKIENVAEQLGDKYERLSEATKKLLESNKTFKHSGYKRVLGTIQDRVNIQFEKSKENCEKFSSSIKENDLVRKTTFAAFKKYEKSKENCEKLATTIKRSNLLEKTTLAAHEQFENTKENCEKLVTTIKRSNLLEKTTLAAHEQFENTKVNCEKLAATIRRSNLVKRTAFRAASIGLIQTVKAQSPTTGYNEHDLDILKQLGIVTTNTSNTASASTSHLDTSDTSDSSHNAFDSASASEFPPSLFDSQNSYSSIFDNMPEERNDLYTTISNIFSTSTDKTTQVTSGDLRVENTDTMQENNTHDYVLIETPGAERVPAMGDEVIGGGGDGVTEALLTATNSEALNQSTEIVAAVANVAANSSMNSTLEAAPSIVVEAIPEPPSAPDLAAEAASQLNALGEATFASLGLGGWTPVGLVQNAFEYLHVVLGVPWWEAIAIGTVVIRLAMFPLVIIAQRNAARMNNYLPQMQVIQMKMTDARHTGNQIEAARYSQELMTFMKEKQLNPLKNMVVPLAQMPIFISFFMGLREMANVPVDSMRTGGLFWFNDLTVPDQFFALPIITSLTLWATIELGTDAGRLNSQNMQTMKYVLRAMPFVILPFTVNFPGAILCYWMSSNLISLAQVGFLKIPAVRDYFKIDPMLRHDPAQMPIKNKGFVGGLKDSWTNMKITKELEERRQLDEIQFNRAGKAPLIKTYKYDPTKQIKPAASKVKTAIKNG